ncbi:MAG: carboxyltransferase domain-containing protein [Polyangiaceae bacterium]|nr:carboxyltransferase domain-containing protein [Polyangiaceae bacterium]
MRASPYGEGGIFVDLELAGPARAAQTRAAARALARALPHAEVVVGAGCVAAFGVGTFDDADDALRDVARAAPHDDDARRVVHELPVVYDGADTEELAAALGATPRELMALHSGAETTVELVGFMPGFAYLAGLPAELHVPRRATPRARVEAGSVGVAGGWGGVYPSASPGGWRIVGRTVADQFDAAREVPARFSIGDRVRFVEVDSLPPAPTPATPSPVAAPALIVAKIAALVTVQDAGRPGWRAAGVPPGGAWDPTALAAANLAVGNAPGAAALEIAGGSVELLALRALSVSLDGAPRARIREGETLRVPSCERFVRVLAVSGGLDAPRVLGSRGASPSVGLGAPLARGDALGLAGSEGPPRAGPTVEAPPSPATLYADPGPHFWCFSEASRQRLFDAVWTRSARGDRVGVRLDGPPLAIDHGPLAFPVPMTRGAIEVPPDGAPIVLGPDHPTTGGYPVIAVLRRASQGVLGRLRPGAELRLRLA